MKVKVGQIKEIHGESPALTRALAWYDKYSPTPLVFDVCEYCAHGVVISRPDVFGMARLGEKDGDLIWFIRFATGNLVELVKLLQSYLPVKADWISFCRDNDGEIRLYPIERFAALAAKTKETIWAE